MPLLSKSLVLRKAQDLILKTKLIHLLNPFSGILHKVYCLGKFAQWKKQYYTSSALTGYADHFALYSALIYHEKLHLFSYLEFGVSKGNSMKWWLSKTPHVNAQFFGFDTFEGIPDDWGTRPKGSYTNEGRIPKVKDTRCKFIKGMFQDTLLPFLQHHKLSGQLILHFDADLYNSTLFCLFAIAPFLKPGDILIFDEFDITTHEFRALYDFQSVFKIDYELIGESNNYNKVVLKIK